MVIKLVIDFGELVKAALKGTGKGVGQEVWGCWVLWPLCVFECISVVVTEGVWVRDCRALGCVQLVQKASQQVVSV
jgi:hypothetical protein